jgi:hypothetical protein
MKFIRHLKAQPDYDPNTSHVVYGQDADLLLLSLVCHEPHFKVMREDNDAQVGSVWLWNYPATILAAGCMKCCEHQRGAVVMVPAVAGQVMY